MEEYLKLLKRRLSRAEDQIQKRRGNENNLSPEGMRMLGYYQGRVSILENDVDEIEEFLKENKP
jgi:hypothetical protein